jgi:hypothetical protein
MKMTDKSKKIQVVDRRLVHLVEATRLNRPPGLFARFLAVMRTAGLVGEKANALLLFLVATSRLLPRPVNSFVKGPSSSGKNFLATRVLLVIPKSEVVPITTTTDTAWNYFGGDLEHKIVYIQEENKATGNVHPARLMISEKEIVRMVAVRTGKTFKTEKQVTKGPISCISTTTRSRVQIDDENRHLSVFMDDSPEQTKRILEARIEKTREIKDTELEAWHGLQAVLTERAKLPIEFGEWRKALLSSVWAEDVRVRRYYPAFEDLCAVVTLLRSLRFNEDELAKKQKHVVTFTDFAITNLLSNDAFSQSLSCPDEEDAELQTAIKRTSERRKGAGVSAKDVANDLGISHDSAYRRIREALERGAIARANKSEEANRKLYLPLKPVQMLPNPETVFQELDLPTVTFAHPVTGNIVRYEKRRKS